MAWQTIRYTYGGPFRCGMSEIHVLPFNDSRMHTFPQCWCKPVNREDNIHVHNAESVPV